MTDVNPTSARPGDLVIAIRNSEPLGVEAVAEILSALGDDYRVLTSGRTLAVREMRSGSLFIHLWDAAQVALGGAAAIVTVVEFSKLLRSAIEATRRGRSLSSRARGMKTVRALIKASRQSHAQIEIEYEGPDERISVRLSRADAEEINLREFNQPALRRPSSPAALPAPTARIDHDIEAFARTATRDDRLSETPETDGLLVLLRTLVQALLETPGGRERMAEISRRLRATGDKSAADFLDSLANPPSMGV